jgi:hypothetical protein
MAGVPGKNKVERGFRFLFDDSGGSLRDLTPGLIPGSAQCGGALFESVDMTAVSNSIKNSSFGWGTANITAKFYMDDTATTGAFTLLKAAPYVGTIAVRFGSNGAAPSTGDPEWGGEYILLGAPVTMEGSRPVMTATWEPSGATPPAWGTVA